MKAENLQLKEKLAYSSKLLFQQEAEINSLSQKSQGVDAGEVEILRMQLGLLLLAYGATVR